MNIVVDASVVVAMLVDESGDGRWAADVLRAGKLFAPELLFVECSNVLRRLERQAIISQPEANAAHQDLMNLDVKVLPFSPLAERIWELRHNLSAHDASYVALAESLPAVLATLDLKLAAQVSRCEVWVPDRAVQQPLPPYQGDVPITRDSIDEARRSDDYMEKVHKIWQLIEQAGVTEDDIDDAIRFARGSRR